MIHPDDVRDDIREYLEGWYEKAKQRQLNKGNRFTLSFGDFITLWGKRRIRSLAQWKDDGSLYIRQRRPTKEDANLNGYCLSWTSYAASQSGEMSMANAQICTRGKSLQDCRMAKGDKHTDAARAKISERTKGVAKTREHRDNISRSMTGLKRGPMTQEEKDKRSATVRATLARKKAGCDRPGAVVK